VRWRARRWNGARERSEEDDVKRTGPRRAGNAANRNGASRNGHGKPGSTDPAEGWRLKVGLAEMLKGGVIMDVMTSEQARIAEEAGAAAVMALERIPARIRREGGVARMSDPKMILEIEEAVSIPVMAKCRIGHFAEARILEALGIDFIDESEVLTPADEEHHVWKHDFKVPFVCGCRDLGEALRRIGEGAAMIRTKGEAGTGNVVEAVRHMRAVQTGIKHLTTLRDDELMAEAKKLGAPFEIVRGVARSGKLPVPNFAAGGVATPADAALMVELGAESVFVGSGIFEVGLDLEPKRQRKEQLRMAQAIVKAVTHHDRPDLLAELSTGLPQPMRGVAMEAIPETEQLAKRGW
jgi:pyridoxal 5'-phosphate synthase pdxS subunit